MRSLLAILLACGQAAAQTVAPVVAIAPVGAPASIAAAATPSVALSPAAPASLALPAPQLWLSPAPSLTPTLSPMGEREKDHRQASLATLRHIAPALATSRAGDALENLFTGRAALAAADETPADAPEQGKLSIEQFARAGEQAFYGGRLREGQHGVVIEAAPRARPEGALPSDSEMDRRMRVPTLSNPEREQAGLELFQLAGAAPEVLALKPGEAPRFDKFDTVMVQDTGEGKHNLIVVKRGRDPNKVIVVGAHHDKVEAGEGKIDNWSGATMMANLYQAMKEEPTEATYVFVMFAREEEGLRGSQFFVRSLTPELKGRIRSMVNVDTVGVDGTFSWKNNSTRYLLDLVARVAKEKALDHQEMYLDGGDADSSTFKRFTPAITVFGASPDVIWDILHSKNDNMGAFVLTHYVNATKLVLELLKALDRETPPRIAAARVLVFDRMVLLS